MKIIEWLTDLVRPRAEKDFRLACQDRVVLGENAFLKKYYGGLGDDQSKIVLVALRVVQKQLGISGIRPNDNLAEAFPDIDFSEIVIDVWEELVVRKLAAGEPDMADFSGTLSSIVEHFIKLKGAELIDDPNQ